MNCCWFPLLCALFLVGCQSQRESEDLLLLPNSITVLRSQAEVRAPAVVLLRSGWLEQAVCTPQTRVHESLFALLASPSELHAALLLAGATPGAPGCPPTMDKPGQRPSGSPLEVCMNHDGGRIALQSLVIDDRNGQGLSGDFVFAGSMFVEWQGVSRYLANDEGSVVGLATFGDELVAYSEPRSALIDQARPVFRPNIQLLPPPGTEVVLSFKVEGDPEN